MQGYVRRVVTGHDDSGNAVVVSDGPAPFVHVTPLNVGWSSTDIWRTHDTPAPVTVRAEEPTLGPRRQLPTKNGTVLRINTYPPESESIRNLSPSGSKEIFASLGNEQAATFGRGGRHPMMHRTETIDYAIVLEGEIHMVIDQIDVHLQGRRRRGTMRHQSRLEQSLEQAVQGCFCSDRRQLRTGACYVARRQDGVMVK